ncbi:MAG: hypothetical protein ACXWQ5_00300 [Ktedonobacterales bacterium]
MPSSQRRQVQNVTVICTNCSAPFERPENEIALKRACGQREFFCQRTCYHAFKSAQRRTVQFVARF